jgi:hypothetical protein
VTQPTGDAYDILLQMLREWVWNPSARMCCGCWKRGGRRIKSRCCCRTPRRTKRRFAGNQQRRKLGLPVLSPREYLETEAAYRQVMESAGLPRGFYDSPDDFSSWIGLTSPRPRSRHGSTWLLTRLSAWTTAPAAPSPTTTAYRPRTWPRTSSTGSGPCPSSRGSPAVLVLVVPASTRASA